MEDFLLDSEVYKVRDERFDIETLSECQLYIKIFKSRITLTAFNFNSKACVFFESYTIDPSSSSTGLVVRLENLWNTHTLINARFWHKIIFVLANQEFTFIPNEYLISENAHHYIRLNCEFDLRQSDIKQTNYSPLDISCFFPLNKELKTWISEKYDSEKIEILHSNMSFLKGTLSFINVADQNTLFLQIEKSRLTIVSLSQEKLKFINSFIYESAEDFIYFILFVMDELLIPASKAKVTLWGDIDEDDEKYRILKKYVKEVYFGKRPMHLKFSYVFDEIPEYYDFDLLSAFDLIN